MKPASILKIAIVTFIVQSAKAQETKKETVSTEPKYTIENCVHANCDSNISQKLLGFSHHSILVSKVCARH